ncbi:hypothetical protein ACN47E_008995 [Coniothyrium glycines]
MQSTGAKRSMEDDKVKLANKRKKVAKKSIQPLGQMVTERPTTPETTFSFLNLPGELRNRIYDAAAQSSHAFFPHTWPKPKPHHPKRPHPNRTMIRPSTNTPLPFIGLSQSCTLIRTEFRPLWLSTHRFPLFAVPGYLKAFYPVPRPALPAALRRRMASYTGPAGTLRLYVTRAGLGDVDVLRLLKHKARFPACELRLVGGLGVDAATLAAVQRIVGNENAKWKKWIKGSVVRQVRLRGEAGLLGEDTVRIVVRQEEAEPWMKDSLRRPVPEEFAKGLGLEGVGWKVEFGVDYS